MKFRSILAIAAISLLATGCAQNRTLSVSAKPIERAPIIVPKVDAISTRDVKWIVVTEDNVDQVFADLKKNGDNLALFAVTDKGYEAISLNYSEIRKLVIQQRSVIGAYKDYYEN